MFQHHRYAMAGLASLAVATVIAYATGRSSPPVMTATANPEQKFDQVFNDVAVTVIPKTEPDGPRIVKTEPIKPKPFEDVILTPPPELPKVKVAVAEKEINLCTRHNMHKVWVNKYKWRCKK